MVLKVVQACDCKVDTVVRFTKANTAPVYTCPTLQAAYDTAFGGDCTDLKAGDLKVLRLKVEDNFVNLVTLGFDCNAKTAVEDFRKGTLKIGEKLKELKSKNILVDKLTNLIFADKADIVRQFAETLPLCDYSFETYLSKKSEPLEQNVFIMAEPEYAAAALEGVNIARGVCIARDLTNEPAETLTPAELANRVEAFGKEFGFSTTVYGAKECERMGMRLLMAVGRASVNEPKLIVMRLNGGNNQPPMGVIGKGLTYDSGGLYLKPGAGMAAMKSDMAGSAAVIGAMCAMAANKVSKNVVAVVAACENLIDGTGYRNGDIFKSMNGQTVLIGSTDAEGRLTLADAMTYIIRNEKVADIIELSTLTGSCANFLGNVCCGVFTTDDSLWNKLEGVGSAAGEKYSRLPSYEEYREFIKSPIADLYNSSNTGMAGGICAGMFLDSFREETPFIHLDVAGTTFAKAKTPGQPEGGTGWGVKTVYNYIKK